MKKIVFLALLALSSIKPSPLLFTSGTALITPLAYDLVRRWQAEKIFHHSIPSAVEKVIETATAAQGRGPSRSDSYQEMASNIQPEINAMAQYHTIINLTNQRAHWTLPAAGLGLILMGTSMYKYLKGLH